MSTEQEPDGFGTIVAYLFIIALASFTVFKVYEGFDARISALEQKREAKP